jgi:hypothetical protein
MSIAPNLTPANFFEMGLEGCPADVELEIHRMALDCVDDLQPDSIIATDGRG